jgi:hypothetical protein
MPAPTQNYQNHARFFPLYHFIVAPILLINLVVAAWQVFRAPGLGTLWAMLVAFALVGLALAARFMALTVQDRVIRLEMQQRFARLLPQDLQPRTAAAHRRNACGPRPTSAPTAPRPWGASAAFSPRCAPTTSRRCP